MTSSASHPNEEATIPKLLKKTVVYEFESADDEELEKAKDVGADETDEADEGDDDEEEDLADDDEDDDDEAVKPKRKR